MGQMQDGRLPVECDPDAALAQLTTNERPETSRSAHFRDSPTLGKSFRADHCSGIAKAPASKSSNLTPSIRLSRTSPTYPFSSTVTRGFVSITLSYRDVEDLFLSGWSPTTCDHTAPRSGSLGSNATMSAGDGRTTELRIRISRRGGGSARCSGSRARVQPRNFFPHTPPSTIPSTSNAISSPPKRTARFALRR